MTDPKEKAAIDDGLPVVGGEWMEKTLVEQVLESPIRNTVILQPPITDFQARAFAAIRELERWKAAIKRAASGTEKVPAAAWSAMRDGDLDALEAALGIGDREREKP